MFEGDPSEDDSEDEIERNNGSSLCMHDVTDCDDCDEHSSTSFRSNSNDRNRHMASPVDIISNPSHRLSLSTIESLIMKEEPIMNLENLQDIPIEGKEKDQLPLVS